MQSEDDVRVSENSLKSFCVNVLVSSGVPREDADVVTSGIPLGPALFGELGEIAGKFGVLPPVQVSYETSA